MPLRQLSALIDSTTEDELLRTLLPEPPQSAEEISVPAALHLDHAAATAAIAIEMDKQLTKYGAIRPIHLHDIKPNAVRTNGKLFLKPKFHSGSTVPYKMSARLAANGQRQPSDSYVSTYAATTDDACKMAMLAAYTARAQQQGTTASLQISDFDINGAFLHETLTPLNSPRQIVMKLPDKMPHPLAGTWVEILRAVYGLKQSNNIFDTGLQKTLQSAGFHPTYADPRIFVKLHPSCAVAMHVDDGLICSTHRPYYDTLISALTARYGPLSLNEECTSNTGYSLHRAPDGSLTVTQEGYLRRMLIDLGAQDLPTASTPSGPDLFHAPTIPTPVSSTHFRRIIGCLIFLLKTRHDIRKEVQYLSTRSTAPTQSCYQKALRVLAYLKTTPTLGARYHTLDGATLYIYADASYGAHTDGRSQTGYYMCIGKNSAPIYSFAGTQKSCVSTGSMEAEYVALTETSKRSILFRSLLISLGFPQNNPTICFQDNMSSIKLAQAPEITRRSRHIFVRHHYIRDLVQQRIIALEYLPTKSMTADLLTKPLARPLFLLLRNRLLNSDEKPPSPFSASGSVRVK